MGYRSNGAFRARGDSDKLFAVIAQLRLTYPDQKELMSVLEDCTLCDNLFGFDFDGWKWYDNYSEVQALNAVMDEFRYMEEEVNGITSPVFDTAWLRIGEEDDDVETSYTGNDPYDLISFVRTYEAEGYPTKENRLNSMTEQTRIDDDTELV